LTTLPPLSTLFPYTTLFRSHIDPLKVNVPAVTSVMSFEFASRHGILCVEVNDREAVIATGQPMITAWVNTVEQVCRKPVRRVVKIGRAHSELQSREKLVCRL